jgi:hypothetical protein
MKIGLLVPGFSAHERDWCIPSYVDCVRGLAAHADVHVFTLRWPERGGEYHAFGALVHAMDGRKRLGLRVFQLWARTLSAIAAEHRRAPFTALHATFADEPALVASWASRWLGIPLVVSVTGGELVAIPEIGYGLQCLPGRRQLVLASLRRASAVTVGSEYLRQIAAAFVPPQLRERIVFAPLGVDTKRFTPARASSESWAGP